MDNVKDEYAGDIDSAGETYVLDEFALESGRRLYRVRSAAPPCDALAALQTFSTICAGPR